MRKPNSIIVLLYIFHIIHPQKQKRSVQPYFCFWGEHSKGLSNQADVELDMINAISAADIAFIMSFTSYCELIECSRPIRFFIVSLMYNNNIYNAVRKTIKSPEEETLVCFFLIWKLRQQETQPLWKPGTLERKVMLDVPWLDPRIQPAMVNILFEKKNVKL